MHGILALGSPVESNNNIIQLCFALPTGEVIIDKEFNTIATLEHNGTYSCIALLNGVPTVASLYQWLCMVSSNEI